MTDPFQELGFDLGFDLTMTLSCPEFLIIESNPLAADALGLSQLPISAEDVIHPEDLMRIRLVVEPLLRRGEAWSGRMRVQRSDGSINDLRATLSARSISADGSTETIAISARDAAEGSPLLAELAYRATHDSLTELPNRALLHDRLGLALARSRRQQTPTAVIFIDLDRFKSINDEHGHGRGDDVLRSAAREMRLALRPSDTIARLGGDEFVAVCSEINDPQQAMTIAHRLAGVLALCETDGDPLKASIGVAVSLDGDITVEEVINAADVAMYEAKRRGRDQVVEYTPSLGDSTPLDQLPRVTTTRATPGVDVDAGSDDRSHADTDPATGEPDAIAQVAAVRSSLRSPRSSRSADTTDGTDETDATELALADRSKQSTSDGPGDGPAAAASDLGSELRFDPVIDLTDGRTVQVAVHRADPETGREAPLGAGSGEGGAGEVIDECVDLAIELFDQYGGDAPPLSVRIDRQGVSGAFKHVAQHVATNLELASDALCLELADEVVRSLANQHLAELHDFASLGVPLTIGGFRRSAPTVGQLASVAARVVKIDPGLVAELDAEHSGRAVDRVVEFASVAADAGIALIAAGVTTRDQIELLLELGCVYAQGPLFGTRLRRSPLEAFLQRPVAAFL